MISANYFSNILYFFGISKYLLEFTSFCFRDFRKYLYLRKIQKRYFFFFQHQKMPTITRFSLIFSMFFSLIFLFIPAKSNAQEGDVLHDGLLWTTANLSINKETLQEGQTPKKSPFTLDLGIQNRMYRNFSTFQTLLGTVHINYRKPESKFGFAVGFIGGSFEPLGILQIAQARINYFNTIGKTKLAITWLTRLTYDYVWNTPMKQGDTQNPINHRVRLLSQFIIPINEKIGVFVSFEPFIIRRNVWFSETRGQLGIRFSFKNASLDVLYFNRWLKPLTNTAPTRFEHALQLTYSQRITWKSQLRITN